MNLTQTIDIPPSRRLIIDVPSEVPVGRSIVVLDFKPVAMNEEEALRRKYAAAIDHCRGLAKRLGARLTSDDFLEQRRRDREQEDTLDALPVAGNNEQ